MQIPVTQEHIAQGQRHNPRSCPIALALKSTNARKRPSVGLTNLRTYLNQHPRRLDHLPPLVEWITAFDAGKPVQPITLELDFTKHTVTIVSPEQQP